MANQLIMRQTLEVPDTAALAAAYGVEFVEARRPERAEADALYERLAQARDTLADDCDALGINSTKQAVLYEPAVFLAQPLTREQVSAINSRETAAVARYCVDIQAGLGQVPIEESGESMAHLPSSFAAVGIPVSFSDVPFHQACGEWAGKPREFWARAGMARRLVIMGKLLESVGASLHIEDAFRPVGVQEGLFQRRVDWTRRDHPDWSEAEILIEAQSKTAIKPKLASHKGGAAIDARLRDQQTGRLLDIGHDYPDGGALVFPRTPFLTARQWRNRQLFQVAAGLSDLTLYIGEDWHVSYGDNLAALDEQGMVRSDYVAQYGPIKEFDRTSGHIIATYEPAEADKVFDYT